MSEGSGLWAFCERCETLFIGVTGNHVLHECGVAHALEQKIEEVVDAGADGDQARVRELVRLLVAGEGRRVPCEARLYRKLVKP